MFFYEELRQRPEKSIDLPLVKGETDYAFDDS